MTGLPGSKVSLGGTPTLSSSSPQSTPTESFSFANVPFMTTCTAATVTWNYAGPDEYISLFASTSIAPHPDGDTVNSTALVMNAPVALDIFAGLQSYTWSPVNLTSGWYTLQAAGPDFQVQSQQFWINNGTDTSCLSAVSSSSISSTASTTPTTAPSVIATSDATSPTSSALPIPVSDAVSTHARTGAIAGGVIGGIAIIAAAIAAYVYFGVCRRTPTRSRRRAMNGSGRSGQLAKWGGLSSRDSGMDVGLPVSSLPTSGKPPLVVGLPNRRATTEFSGAILTPLSSTAHGHSVAASRGASDEDISTVEGEEKIVSSRGLEFYEAVPPHRRRSSASGSSAVTPVTEPPSAHGTFGRSRARSSSQSHRALALAKLDGENTYAVPSSVPPTPSSRSPPVVRRSVDSMQLRTFDTPIAPLQSPLVQPSQINRTASGNGPRRAARKPVPTLTEAEMLPPSSATTPTIVSSAAASTTSVSPAPSALGASRGSRSPTVSPHPMYRNNSGSGSGSTLRAPAAGTPVPGRQHSREDLLAAGMDLPNLNHKSSFGDKPVHYIIPDMPPPP
ncbi:hypothetical protein BD414DRAFT_386100, partial [Trametes punicea]